MASSAMVIIVTTFWTFAWLLSCKVSFAVDHYSVNDLTAKDRDHFIQAGAFKHFELLDGQHRAASDIHQITFAIQRDNTSFLTDLLHKVSDPYHPWYGRHLDRSEINDAIRTKDKLQVVKTYLEREGFTIVHVSKHAEYITVDGRVGAWDAFFSTSLLPFKPKSRHMLRQMKRRDKLYRTMSSFTLPPILGPLISHIFQLTDFPVPAFDTSVKTQPKRFSRGSLRSNEVKTEAFSFLSGYTTPALINRDYDIRSNRGNNLTTQAMYQYESYFSSADLLSFQNMFDLPKETVAVDIGGAQNDALCASANNFACAEASLDLQYMMAIAQGVPTIMYEWLDESDPWLSWIRSVSDLNQTLDVISISYISYEYQFPVWYATAFAEEAMLLGLQGTTILAATGDDGVSGYLVREGEKNCGYFPMFPASCPYVTAIGGTSGPEFGSEEVVCQAQTDKVYITTGGGFSNLYATPSWQKNHVSTYLSFASSSASGVRAGYNISGRGYPDVSLLANNYLVSLGGDLIGVSGTSASCPVVGAMVSLVNSARLARNASRLGWINPLLYSNYSSLFVKTDIVTGDNSCTGNASICCGEGFPATTGWDAATGIGVLNFTQWRDVALSLVSTSDMITWTPSRLPTATPSISLAPSTSPTLTPSATPTFTPLPTETPSAKPSPIPSRTPSRAPSRTPSASPTRSPSQPPSAIPTQVPTYASTMFPSSIPSETPSMIPTLSPSSLAPTAVDYEYLRLLRTLAENVSLQFAVSHTLSPLTSNQYDYLQGLIHAVESFESLSLGWERLTCTNHFNVSTSSCNTTSQILSTSSTTAADGRRHLRGQDSASALQTSTPHAETINQLESTNGSTANTFIYKCTVNVTWPLLEFVLTHFCGNLTSSNVGADNTTCLPSSDSVAAFLSQVLALQTTTTNLTSAVYSTTFMRTALTAQLQRFLRPLSVSNDSSLVVDMLISLSGNDSSNRSMWQNSSHGLSSSFALVVNSLSIYDSDQRRTASNSSHLTASNNTSTSTDPHQPSDEHGDQKYTFWRLRLSDLRRPTKWSFTIFVVVLAISTCIGLSLIIGLCVTCLGRTSSVSPDKAKDQPKDKTHAINQSQVPAPNQGRRLHKRNQVLDASSLSPGKNHTQSHGHHEVHGTVMSQGEELRLASDTISTTATLNMSESAREKAERTRALQRMKQRQREKRQRDQERKSQSEGSESESKGGEHRRHHRHHHRHPEAVPAPHHDPGRRNAARDSKSRLSAFFRLQQQQQQLGQQRQPPAAMVTTTK